MHLKRYVWNTLKQCLSLERHKYTLHFLQCVRVLEVQPGRLTDLNLSTDGQWSYEPNCFPMPGIFTIRRDSLQIDSEVNFVVAIKYSTLQ